MTGCRAAGLLFRVGREASFAPISRASYRFCVGSVGSTVCFLASEVEPEWLPSQPPFLDTSMNSWTLSCWTEVSSCHLGGGLREAHFVPFRWPALSVVSITCSYSSGGSACRSHLNDIPLIPCRRSCIGLDCKKSFGETSIWANVRRLVPLAVSCRLVPPCLFAGDPVVTNLYHARRTTLCATFSLLGTSTCVSPSCTQRTYGSNCLLLIDTAAWF